MSNYLERTANSNKPDFFYYNSVGGDWVEIYFKKDGKVDLLHTMFWKGSGYIPKHKHECSESFRVLKGSGYYFIEGKGYINTNDQSSVIPKNIYHINPVNKSYDPLVVLYEDISECQLAFYQTYYEKIQMEEFVKNPNGLPRWMQLLKMNRHLNKKTVFHLGAVEFLFK